MKVIAVPASLDNSFWAREKETWEFQGKLKERVANNRPVPVQNCDSNRLRTVHHSVPCLAMLTLLACSHLLGSSASAQTVSLTPSLTKIAGTNSSGAVLFTLDYGTATSVALDTPNFVVFDALGNQYFSDTGSNCVRVISTGGTTSTVAGLVVGGGYGDTCNAVANPTPTSAEGLLNPTGIAVAPNGDLYIADTGHNCIRRLRDKFTGTADLVTVAGTCTATATLSQTPSPGGLALDNAGNLYIAINDSSDGIQQVLRQTLTPPRTTACVMAGAPSALAPTTCPGVTNNTITLNGPNGLTINGEGSLLIADTGNKCVREVAGMTTIQTVVGRCTNDSSGPAGVSLTAPYGLQFDQTQALLISDGNQVLRHVIGSSALNLLAGLSSQASGPYETTQDGKAGQLDPLNAPRGLAIDSYGNITVADSGNHILRELFPNTIFSATPVNSASSLQLITFTINQNVNLAATVGTDYSISGNTCIGSLTYAGAGNPPASCQVSVTFTPTRPGIRNAQLTFKDSSSNTEVITGLQGLGTGSQFQFFPGVVNSVASGLAKPADIAVDIDSNAYILEQGSAGPAADIKELVAASGTVRTVIPAGSGIGNDPVALVRDSAGNLFVADQTAGNVTRFAADGSPSSTYLTGLVSPDALYVDGFDNLYVAQAGASHNVVEFYASGGERVIAGSGSILNANGTAAVAAQFVSPSGIYVDANGVIYVADSGGHRVYDIDTSGIIHFAAGNGTTSSTSASSPLGTALLGPTSLAVDAAGDLLIADPPANIVYVAFATGSKLLQWAPILGDGTAASTGDGGPSPAAEVNNPLALGVDGSGNTYVIDRGASSVRKISYPAPTLNFGTVAIGATSPTQTATLWSTGTIALSQTAALTISNPNFLLDSSVSTCGASLVAGGTCDLGFYFQPIERGTQMGLASVANNSYLNPGTLTLVGNVSNTAPVNFNLPAETEVYGEAFPEVVSLGLSGTPTGTITFTTGTQILCTFTGNLSATTTCAAPSSGLSVATYPVTFTYSGDTVNAPITATTQLSVTPQPTATTLASSATPIVAGTSITLTASVSSVLGAVTVGSVTFTDGKTTLGTGSLNSSGVATLTTSALQAGTQTVTATYAATLNFGQSSASLSQGVSVPAGSFTIAATPATQYIRGAGSVTWQVTVTPSGGFAGPVALTCSGLPADANCTFAMGTLTLTANTAATTTMTTTTTVNDAALQMPFDGMDLGRQLSCAFLLPFQMSSGLLTGFRRRKARSQRPMRLWLLAGIAICLLGLSGCNCFNTTFRTYTITVTGISTLGGPPAQSVTVQLSVGRQ